MRFWPWLLLTTLVVVVPQAPLAAPAKPKLFPRIQLNDNHHPTRHFVDGVLKLSLVSDTGLWYPAGENEPGIPIQAFRDGAGPLQIPGPLVRVPAGTMGSSQAEDHRGPTVQQQGWGRKSGQ
jgi:hypothetical protein